MSAAPLPDDRAARDIAPGAGPARDPARAPWRATLALAAAAALAMFALAARKHAAFLSDDLDLGLFTQAVDRLLHGSLWSSIRGMSWLGDHTSLNLLLVAPLYALLPSPLTLLAVQSAALAAGALPAFQLARRELGDERLALAAAALYLAFPALWWVATFEFHPEALAVAPLLAAFLALRAGRTGPCLAWAFVALLAKEDVALPVLAMALAAAFTRRPRRLAAGLVGLAAGFLALSFLVIKPALGARGAEYALLYGGFGDSPSAIALGLLRDPFGAAALLVATPGDAAATSRKLLLWVHLLAPVGFVALAGPAALALALPTLASHLLSSRAQQHTLAFQYGATVAPFVIAAAVLGIRRLAAGDPARARRWMAAALTAAGIGLVLFTPWSPLPAARPPGAFQNLAPSAAERAEASWREAFVRQVPDRVPVVAGFEFLSRLAARDSLHSLHHVLGGRYTWSRRPYPVPGGIECLVADLADPRLLPWLDGASSARFADLLVRNGLAPVEAAGDLVLFRRGAPGLALIAPARGPGPAPGPADGGLEWCGAAIRDPRPLAPGATLDLTTSWRRRGAVRDPVIVGWIVRDANGREVHAHARHLGYLAFPPAAWPAGVVMEERYRLVLPAGLPAGRYVLAMRAGWRRGREAVVMRLPGGAPDGAVVVGGFVLGAGR